MKFRLLSRRNETLTKMGQKRYKILDGHFKRILLTWDHESSYHKIKFILNMIGEIEFFEDF